MTSAFVLDPQIATASTPPASWYTDPNMLTLEREKIFRTTWQYAASLDLLRLPGNYAAVDVMGMPIILTRGQDGVLRAFYNVCRHRAGVVARGSGNRKTLQCQYHGWLYGLDGCLRTTPEFDAVEGFNKDDYGLVPVRVETWGPFAFVNMDQDAPPLIEVLGDIPAETARFSFDNMRRVARRDYFLQANWKVYVDNYLEGYHVPIAHPGLYRELDYEQYRVDTFRYYSSQYAPIRPAKSGDVQGRDRRYVRTEDEAEALYYWIFPNVMLNIYPDNMSINIILPLGHDKTLTIFEWYFEEPGTGEGWESMQQTIAFSDEIQQEDIEICVAVQQGLN